MKTFFARVVLSLLVAMLGGLLGAGTSALADSSAAIAISGTVDGLPESVYVSGLAQITSTLVKADAKFHHPRRVMLSIDLHNVSGQGLSTGATYVSNSQDEVMRRLVASDLVEITFPLFECGRWLEHGSRGARVVQADVRRQNGGADGRDSDGRYSQLVK